VISPRSRGSDRGTGDRGIGETGERLVRAIRAGDEAAWDELIETFGGVVLHIARRAGLDHADQEEVFQETWRSLHVQITALRTPSSLAAWVHTTAARQCVFVRRRRIASGDLPDLRDAQPIPEDELAELEEAGLIREEAAALPEPCRSLLRMLFFEEPAPSYAELAERLGRATNTIGPARMRCLAELGERLERRGFR
jgi:RNA polymerase sigma factor (sigma-70 family)